MKLYILLYKCETCNIEWGSLPKRLVINNEVYIHDEKCYNCYKLIEAHAMKIKDI